MIPNNIKKSREKAYIVVGVELNSTPFYFLESHQSSDISFRTGSRRFFLTCIQNSR